MRTINRRSRLTTLVPNNLWDIKKTRALFEKSRGRSPRCGGLSLSVISSVVLIDAWVGGRRGGGGVEIQIRTNSGCQRLLHMLMSDLKLQKLEL